MATCHVLRSTIQPHWPYCLGLFSSPEWGVCVQLSVLAIGWPKILYENEPEHVSVGHRLGLCYCGRRPRPLTTRILYCGKRLFPTAHPATPDPLYPYPLFMILRARKRRAVSVNMSTPGILVDLGDGWTSRRRFKVDSKGLDNKQRLVVASWRRTGTRW